MLLEKFSPPAYLDDYDAIPHQRDAWSEMVSASFDSSITCIENPGTCGRTGPGVGAGNSQFYNPMKTDVTSAAADVDIMWLGYPRRLTVTYGEEEGLKKADEIHPLTDFLHGDPVLEPLKTLYCRGQDEYCEWYAERDHDTNKIRRITFTCEPPEYWSALASGYPSNPFYYSGPQTTGATGDADKLLALYRELVSPAVQEEDLFFQDDTYACPDEQGNNNGFLKGQYNPYNKWNTTDGIVHLTHPANTLLAEIQLGADGTVLRTKDGRIVLEADQLICCAAYGGVNRSSDPNIGNSVNQLARLGALVALRDPVGLYMDSFNTAGWTKPDGVTPIGNYWTIVRGRPGMVVRVVFEVPAEEGFTVSDVLIGGEPVRYPGQIAQAIKMKLTGTGFIPEEKKGPAFVACQYQCCANVVNTGQLQVVSLTSNCPTGFEPATPGIEVLSSLVARSLTLAAVAAPAVPPPAVPRPGRRYI